MPYIEKICTTVHLGEGRPEEIGLYPKTLVVGPTGAGKTRIVTSIALLLTGAADDVLGRDEVGSPGDLILLAPPDRDLEVRGWWTDKATVGLEVKRKAGGGTTVKQHDGGPCNGHEWTHPVRKVSELLALSPAEARKAFLPFIVGDVTGVIGRMLPSQFVTDPRAPRIESVGDLVRALDLAKTRMREESNKIKANEDLSDKLAGALAPPPSEDQLRFAVEAEDAARRYVEQLRAARLAAQSSADRVNEYNAIAQEYTSLEAAVADLERVAKPPTADHMPLLEAAATVLTEATKLNLDKCPMCLSVVGAPHLHTRKAAVEGVVNGTRAETAAWREAQAKVKAGRARMEQLRARAEGLAQTVQGSAGVVVTDEEIAQAEQQYQGYHAVVMQARNLRGQWETVQRAREVIAQARNEQSWWESFHTELTKVRDRLLEEGRAVFEAQIGAWLPKGLGVRVMLETPEGKETFRLALVKKAEKDGGPEMTTFSPSGGQRAALLLATAVVCLKHLPEHVQKYAVVMLDEERGMDPAFLAEVMRALRNVPYQIVLTSLHPPRGKAAAGWTVMDLGKAESGRKSGKKSSEDAAGEGGENEAGAGDGNGAGVAEA